MLWIYETPKVISQNYVLPILKQPICWLKGSVSAWIQYGLYKTYITAYDTFYAAKHLTVYELPISAYERIRIAQTIRAAKPKLIVLYCHTLGGTYEQFSHLTNELRNDPVIYFSYSRKGSHSDLPTSEYNVLGSLEVLNAVINHIMTRYPSIPIHAIGSSAGACLLTRYLAMCNQDKKIKSSVLISPGYDFQQSIVYMESKVQALLLSSLKSVYNHCSPPEMRESANLIEWIHHHYKSAGYDTPQQFMLYNDPRYFLHRINVPTILISALDDFCFPGYITQTYADLPFQNKNITLVMTKYGGHISFVDYRQTIPWSSRVALAHIRSKLILPR